MNLKEVMKYKINNIREQLSECKTCKKVTPRKELEYNATFPAYAKEICNVCADKIDA